MQGSPLFSIVVPTFNRPAMLKRAIESIERQTLTDFEIIISDDGSSADINEVVACFPGLRISLLRSGENAGATVARNRGIDRSSGRYIAFLDDDDEYLPDFLASTLETLERSPREIGYSWSNICNVRYVDGRAVAWEPTNYVLPDGSSSMPFEDALTIGVGYGVTVRRDALLAIGCFDSSLKVVEDTDLFMSLLSSGILSTLVPGVNVRVHHHAGERMTSSSMNAIRIRECWMLMDKHARFLAEHPRLERQLMSTIRSLQQESLLAEQADEKMLA